VIVTIFILYEKMPYTQGHTNHLSLDSLTRAAGGDGDGCQGNDMGRSPSPPPSHRHTA